VRSGAQGGGLQNEGTATLEAIAVDGNVAHSEAGGVVGGGVFNAGATSALTVRGGGSWRFNVARTNSLTADAQGGGLYTADGSTVLNGTVLELNAAFGASPGPGIGRRAALHRRRPDLRAAGARRPLARRPAPVRPRRLCRRECVRAAAVQPHRASRA